MPKILFFAIAIFVFSNIAIAQTNEIKIRFIGNCGLHITDGTSHIYSDFPYQSGAYGYPEYDQSEIDNLEENAHYIFTHKHRDHYYRGHAKKIIKAKNGKKYSKRKIKKIENAIPDFKIESFKTKHLYSFSHHSYLITWHGKKIFLSGDTEHIDTVIKMKDLDWAFVPIWLVEGTTLLEKLDTKNIGIYHLYPGEETNVKADKVLLLDKQGEVITISY